jgi:hypothetical protein
MERGHSCPLLAFLLMVTGQKDKQEDKMRTRVSALRKSYFFFAVLST